MEQAATRRHFIGVMGRIMGTGALMTSGVVPFGNVFAQAKDSIGVGWLRLACTGQSFVSEGAGHGAWQELMLRHQLFNAGAETIEALSAGVLDSSYLGVTPAIAAISRGVPAKIYVGGHKRGMGMVVRGDSPIKSVKDLRGKNVATLGRGSLPDMQLRVTAKDLGLEPDRDFNLITLPSADAVTALSKGGVDALMNCPEWPQVALTSVKGSRFVASDVDNTLWHGPNTQCVVVIVKEKFAKENPKVLKKLLHVHVKASRTMVQDPGEAARIIAKFEGAPPEATKLALSHMYVSPVPSVDSIVKWRDKMLEFGFMKRKAKIDELIELAPLREVLQEAGEKEWLADLDKEIQVLNDVRKREA
jgi:NitT/TauT family transport system substrate-binding protein